MIRRTRLSVRRGMSSATEMVLTLAVMFPATVALAVLFIQLCRAVYYTMASMIGWPYL